MAPLGDETSGYLVKVCGMLPGSNMLAVSDLHPDYLGVIFYPDSPRFVGLEPIDSHLSKLSDSIKTIGVFVDAPVPEVALTVTENGLGGVQLHGEESPEYCRAIRKACPGIVVFKAVRVGSALNVESLKHYDGVVDMFVFDTAGALKGGTGRSFDWSLLGNYKGRTRFLVAGGIGTENIDEAIAACTVHERFAGFDVNSAVETEPGIKDIALVKDVMRRIRNVIRK